MSNFTNDEVYRMTGMKLGGHILKIGIIGYGYVGHAIGEAVKNHYELVISDKYKGFTDDVELADVIFLCVPTPMKENGEMDTSNLEDALSSLKTKNNLIVIKSTIVPFTTKYLSERYEQHFVHSPEFLRETNSFEDFLKSDRIVIGAETEHQFKIVKEIYKTILNRDDIVFFHTTWEEAEMCKYVANSFLALKVSFANEVYSICEKFNLDWEKIRAIWASDSRVGDSHTYVPGPDGYFGYGGKCFPKDVNAMLSFLKNHDLEIKTVKSAQDVNDNVRNFKDWEHIVGAVSGNNYREI